MIIGEALKENVSQENFDKFLAICQIFQNVSTINFCAANFFTIQHHQSPITYFVQVYPFIGLDYWTEVFSLFRQGSVFVLIILERSLYYFKIAKELAAMDDCNNDNKCLLQCFQQCINLKLWLYTIVI